MKQFTNISDQELRSLLNQMLLSESESGINPSKLLEMETSIILKNAPIHAVNLTIGATLLSKLKAKILYKMALKWLVTASIITGSSLAVYKGFIQPEYKKSKKEKANSTYLVSKKNDSLKKEAQIIASTIPSVQNQVQNSLFLPFKSVINNVQFNFEPEKSSSFVSDLSHLETFQEVNGIQIESCDAKIVIVGSASQRKVSLKTNIDDTINNKELAKYISIETKTENGILKINVSNRIKKTVKLFSKIQETLTAELYLEVPENVTIDIKNQSGNCSVSGIVSDLINIHNDYGNLKLTNIKAKANYDVESGNIDIQHHIGDLTVDCEYGNIALKDSEGNIISKIESGSFKSEHTNGNIHLRNQYGNVSIMEAKGAELKLKIESGNFSIENSQFDQTEANITYGNSSLNHFTSDINIKNESGNIKFNKTKGNINVISSYGNQVVDFHEGNMDLKTNSGKLNFSNVTGDVAIKGEYTNANINSSRINLNIDLVSGNFIGTEITLVNQALMKSDYGNITLKTTNNLDELNCKIQSNDGTASINKNGVNIKKSDEQIVLEKGKILVSANTNAGNIKIE